MNTEGPDLGHPIRSLLSFPLPLAGIQCVMDVFTGCICTVLKLIASGLGCADRLTDVMMVVIAMLLPGG
jgi:hypothetical protein